ARRSDGAEALGARVLNRDSHRSLNRLEKLPRFRPEPTGLIPLESCPKPPPPAAALPPVKRSLGTALAAKERPDRIPIGTAQSFCTRRERAWRRRIFDWSSIPNASRIAFSSMVAASR